MKAAMLLVLLLAGCAQTASNVRLVSFVSDAHPGKSIGPIVGSDCATRIFGIGRSPESLTIDNAIRRARKSAKFRYLNGMSVERTSMTMVIYEQDCLRIKGEAFR